MAYHAVDVTEEDIALGQPGNNRLCAISRSIKRSRLARVASTYRIRDDTVVVRLSNCPNRVTTFPSDPEFKIEADLNVSDWVREFDCGKPVESFSFKINLPDDWPVG